MPEDDETPRGGIRKRPRDRRAQSPTERVLEGRSDDVAVEHVDEEITGNYAGDELATFRRIRAERDPVGTIVRLEAKHDDLADQVKETRGDLASIRRENTATRTELANARLDLANTNTRLGEAVGKMSASAELIPLLRDSLKAHAEIEHTKVTKTLEVDTARKITALKIAEAETLDTVDARKARRAVIIKLAGAVASGGAIWEIVRRLIG